MYLEVDNSLSQKQGLLLPVTKYWCTVTKVPHCFPLLRCVYLLSDNVFVQCQQMALEVNGSESPNGHSRAKKEYYDLDRNGCVVADDLGPVDLSKWRSYCQR